MPRKKSIACRNDMIVAISSSNYVDNHESLGAGQE